MFKKGTDIPIEDYIERFYSPSKTGKLLACLGFTVPIDKYFPEGASCPMMFYWIWCPVHKKYKASYLHGHDQVTVCSECEEERRQEIRRLNEENFGDEDLF